MPPRALLQVLDVDDVGVSGQALLEALQARRAAAVQPEARAERLPRGMLRLSLSDGFASMPLLAYESSPIASLDVELPLGTKVEVRHAELAEGGLWLLKSECIVIKGGHLPELAEESLERRIRRRLGLPERESTDGEQFSSPTAAAGNYAAVAQPLGPGSTTIPTGTARNSAPTRSSPAVDGADDVWDLDAEQVMLEAEQALFDTDDGHGQAARTTTGRAPSGRPEEFMPVSESNQAFVTPTTNAPAHDASHPECYVTPTGAGDGADLHASGTPQSSWLLQQLHATPRAATTPASATAGRPDPKPSTTATAAADRETEGLKIPSKDTIAARGNVRGPSSQRGGVPIVLTSSDDEKAPECIELLSSESEEP